MKTALQNALAAIALVCGLSASTLFAASITGFDPTFETPAFGAGTFNYNPTAAYTSTSGIINPPSGFGAPAAPEGSQVGFLQTNQGDSHFSVTDGLISGTITGLTVGQSYTISGLEASRESPTTASFTVTVGGILEGTESATSNASYNTFTSSTFVATATSESLALLSTGPSDSTTFIDNLQVNNVGVPEPASFVLFGLGAVGLFIAARRRRRNG